MLQSMGSQRLTEAGHPTHCPLPSSMEPPPHRCPKPAAVVLCCVDFASFARVLRSSLAWGCKWRLATAEIRVNPGSRSEATVSDWMAPWLFPGGGSPRAEHGGGPRFWVCMFSSSSFSHGQGLQFILLGSGGPCFPHLPVPPLSPADLEQLRVHHQEALCFLEVSLAPSLGPAQWLSSAPSCALVDICMLNFSQDSMRPDSWDECIRLCHLWWPSSPSHFLIHTKSSGCPPPPSDGKPLNGSFPQLTLSLSQAGTRDLGPFAAVLAPGQTSPPATKYKGTIRD